MLEEPPEIGENTGSQSEQSTEPTIWDFIEMNKSGKYTHLKITPGTEEDKMLNLVALYLPDKSKTTAARLLIKAGFKVFLSSMKNQENSK